MVRPASLQLVTLVAMFALAVAVGGGRVSAEQAAAAGGSRGPF